MENTVLKDIINSVGWSCSDEIVISMDIEYYERDYIGNVE
jgi:hypothetical protein